MIPSRELTYPPDMAYLKMIFLFPRWDMLISWRVNHDKPLGGFCCDCFFLRNVAARLQTEDWEGL